MPMTPSPPGFNPPTSGMYTQMPQPGDQAYHRQIDKNTPYGTFTPPAANGGTYGGQGGGGQSGQVPNSSGYDISRASLAGQETRDSTHIQDLGLGGSSYRSQGYDVNYNRGLVGGNMGVSGAQLGHYGDMANGQRMAGDAFLGQYGQGSALNLDARNQQMGGLGMTADAANMYRNMALGQGPSLAQAQLQQGLQAAQAQQLSAAAGARGGGANLAAMQLGAATQMGQNAAATNEAMSRARIQEQLGAMQGYGGLAGQYGQLAGAMRGQDLGYAGMGLQGYGMSQNNALSYEQLRQQQQLAELQAQAGLEATQGKLAVETQGQVGQQAQAQAKEKKGIAGIIAGIGGGLMGAAGGGL